MYQEKVRTIGGRARMAQRSLTALLAAIDERSENASAMTKLEKRRSDAKIIKHLADTQRFLDQARAVLAVQS